MMMITTIKVEAIPKSPNQLDSRMDRIDNTGIARMMPHTKVVQTTVSPEMLVSRIENTNVPAKMRNLNGYEYAINVASENQYQCTDTNQGGFVEEFNNSRTPKSKSSFSNLPITREVLITT